MQHAPRHQPTGGWQVHPGADDGGRSRAYRGRRRLSSRSRGSQSGPYRFVRHPIYTGLLTAMLGTALVDNLLGLIVVAVLVAYFYYCGTVEERNLTATFPTAYPEYRSRTKMLIPFLL